MFYKTLAPGCIGHPEATFFGTAALAAQYGYRGYWFDAGKDLVGDPEETKKVLEKYHLIPAGFGLPVEYRGSEAAYLADMEKLPAYLDFAQAIGIKRCITWIIPSSEELSYEENFELHRRRLTPVAKMLKERNMLFGMEFLGPKKLRKGVKHEFIHSLDEMLKLCDAIGTGNVGILMDAWHWDMAEQKFSDFDKFTSPDQIVCAHVMDAPANVPAEEQEDLVRRLPGTTGIINIEAFFAGLKKVGYDGPVLVEPFEEFLKQIPLEDAIKVVAKSLSNVWPE